MKNFLITYQLICISKNKFAEVALDKNDIAFMIYISILTAKMMIYLITIAQISLLLLEKVIILAKYSDFTNIFGKKFIKILPK